MNPTIHKEKTKLFVISHSFEELQSMLNSGCYEFFAVANIDDALKCVQEQNPNLILLDGKPMRLDSYRFLREIRQSALLSKIPILGILDKDVSVRQVEEALDNGMTKFITYPVPPELLKRKVDYLVEESSTNPFQKEVDYIDATQLVHSLAIPASISIIEIPNDSSLPVVKVKSVNKQFINALGYTLKDIPTMSAWWEKAYPNEEYRHEVKKAWYNSLEKQQNSELKEFPLVEAKIRCKDGIYRWFEVFTFPVGDKHLTGLIDVTRIHETNEKLEQSLESEKAIRQAMSDIQGQMVQNERLAIFGQLAASISHQVANPINFLSVGLENLDELSAEYSGFTRLLLENASKERVEEFEDMDESVQDMISVMKDGSEQIMKVVKYLRDFSETENKSGIQPINLEEVINGAITLTSHLTPGRVKIETDFKEIPSVKGFSQQLSQLFLSLINNAIEATENKKDGIVSVTLKSEGNFNIITIKDNGKGIPEANQEKIFQSFFSTKKVQTNSSSGLGLTIAKQIALEYGGSIWFESEVGKGSTFTVKLPIYVK